MSRRWTTLKDEDLLKVRICDLGLTIAGSELEPLVEQLYNEIAAKELTFRPEAYLGDEWFSPEGVPAIAIPFYLAHPRLKALEQELMFEVEGGNPSWCMRLLRHEAGHSFDHSYRLSRRRRWHELFGSPKQEYLPETYRPRPYSRSFVKHLDNWYAQAHPDEDFAETFAVWLTPDSKWRREYAKWKVALDKLQYVDRLARECRNLKPRPVREALPFNAAKMKSTLGTYYQKRKREHAIDYPGFYDEDLKRIFNGDAERAKREFSASRFMTRNRKIILDSVSYWTGERKFPVEHFLKKLTDRCDELGLRIGRTESETLLEVATYTATLVTNYLFTGQFKRSV